MQLKHVICATILVIGIIVITTVGGCHGTPEPETTRAAAPGTVTFTVQWDPQAAPADIPADTDEILVKCSRANGFPVEFTIARSDIQDGQAQRQLKLQADSWHIHAYTLTKDPDGNIQQMTGHGGTDLEIVRGGNHTAAIQITSLSNTATNWQIDSPESGTLIYPPETWILEVVISSDTATTRTISPTYPDPYSEGWMSLNHDVVATQKVPEHQPVKIDRIPMSAGTNIGVLDVVDDSTGEIIQVGVVALPPPRYEVERIIDGQAGTGPAAFQYPRDIAIGPGGNIFLAASHYVKKFALNGDLLTTWGGPGTGDGQFDEIPSIIVSDNGFVYCTDYGNCRVQYFDTDGNFAGEFGYHGTAQDAFDHPCGIAGGHSGLNIFVADSNNNRVAKYDPLSHKVLAVTDDLTGPGYVAVNAGRGLFYAANMSVSQVQAFPVDNLAATPVWSWGPYGSGPGQFKGATGIDVDPDGLVTVGDGVLNRLQQFTPEGAYVATIGQEGSDPGQFDYPLGITSDDEGKLYVADLENHRVQILSPTR